MKKWNIGKTLFYLFFPLVIGGLVGFFISGNIDYTSLNQPPFAPPKMLFPIAWTILYLLMGISYYLFQKNTKIENKQETIVYYVQLFVNALWSIIFFVWKWRLFAIIWIVLLDLLVLLMIGLFYRKVKISAYLNIPYLLWILFATYLTIGIYLLN